jgi:hypothetical protein
LSAPRLAAKMRAMRTHTTALLNHVVRGFARWLPRAQQPADAPRWEETDRSWHHSSFELSLGVEVIEHFERPPVFPDTMPGFQFPPAAQAVIG